MGEGVADDHEHKKARAQAGQLYNKVAAAENAAAVDKLPPLRILLDAVKNGPVNLKKGDSVVYWMRMEDLRRT